MHGPYRGRCLMARKLQGKWFLKMNDDLHEDITTNYLSVDSCFSLFAESMRTRRQSDRSRRVAINTFTDPQTTGTQSFSCEHGLGSFQSVKHVGVRCSKSTDSQTLLWFDLLLSHLLTQSDVGTAASAAVVTALGGNSFKMSHCSHCQSELQTLRHDTNS